MAVNKPVSSKPRVGATIGERRAIAAQSQAAPAVAHRGVARQVMAHKTQTHKANATYVRGRLESPLAKITKAAPQLGHGFISTDTALDVLNHYFPAHKKA